MKKSKSENKIETANAGLSLKEYEESAMKSLTVHLPLSELMGDPTIKSMILYLDGKWIHVINSEYSANKRRRVK